MGNPEKKRKKKGSNGNESQISNNDSMCEIKLQMEHLEGDMFDLRHALDKAIEDLNEVKTENEKLREDNSRYVHNLSVQSQKLNELEQYSRRSNVRIRGLVDSGPKETTVETEKLVMNFLKFKLGMNIAVSDIDIAHRLGRHSKDGDRPVIVKFASRKTKIITLSLRRKLKGTRYLISEDLTAQNHRLLQQTRDLECVHQCWSKEGRVFAKNKEGDIIEVKTSVTVDELLFQRVINRTSQRANRPVLPPVAPSDTSTNPESANQTLTHPSSQTHVKQSQIQQQKQKGGATHGGPNGSKSKVNENHSDEKNHGSSQTSGHTALSETRNFDAPDSMDTGDPVAASTPNASDIQQKLTKLAEDSVWK